MRVERVYNHRYYITLETNSNGKIKKVLWKFYELYKSVNLLFLGNYLIGILMVGGLIGVGLLPYVRKRRLTVVQN